MSGKALYFPYMRVPTSDWFTRVLLYWDEIGSIITSDYREDAERLGPYTTGLIEADLVRPIIPAAYTYQIPHFGDAFLELIDSNEAITSRRGQSLQPSNLFRIHAEKLGEITDGVERRGLARQGAYPWFEVERTTADLFMAYLASVLGKVEQVAMDPITDNESALVNFTDSPDRDIGANALLQRLRLSVLDSILPAPDHDLEPSEIAAFKERHGSELRRFRMEVEGALLEAATLSDDTLRSRSLRLFQDNAKDQVDELVARMNERNWGRLIFGSLAGLVAAAIPAASALATGALPLAAAAIPGLVKATYSAYEGLGDTQRAILGSPWHMPPSHGNASLN
jgi:hypothetical protein